MRTALLDCIVTLTLIHIRLRCIAIIYKYTYDITRASTYIRAYAYTSGRIRVLTILHARLRLI